MLDEWLVQVLDVDVPVGFVVFHVTNFGAYKTVLGNRIRIRRFCASRIRIQ
jgi:hypothetical protein